MQRWSPRHFALTDSSLNYYDKFCAHPLESRWKGSIKLTDITAVAMTSRRHGREFRITVSSDCGHTVDGEELLLAEASEDARAWCRLLAGRCMSATAGGAPPLPAAGGVVPESPDTARRRRFFAAYDAMGELEQAKFRARNAEHQVRCALPSRAFAQRPLLSGVRHAERRFSTYCLCPSPLAHGLLSLPPPRDNSLSWREWHQSIPRIAR